MAYAHILEVKKTKLDKKAEKLQFVGYTIQLKRHRLLDEKTSKAVIHQDAILNEIDFGYKVVDVQ